MRNPVFMIREFTFVTYWFQGLFGKIKFNLREECLFCDSKSCFLRSAAVMVAKPAVKKKEKKKKEKRKKKMKTPTPPELFDGKEMEKEEEKEEEKESKKMSRWEEETKETKETKEEMKETKMERNGMRGLI